MKDIHCAVIKDLLPLYYDGVCSEETRMLIEEHMGSCNECKKELESLHATIEIPPIEREHRKQDEKMIRKMASSLQKVRKKALYKGIGMTALIGLLMFCVYYSLFEWDIQPVQRDNFNISNVAQLSNGHIVYRVDYLDEYDVMRVKYSLDEEGNFYMTPLRPIVKLKRERPIGDENVAFTLQVNEENWDNREIKALYYGSPDDAVLIWEKGMKLPKASPEVEQSFDMSSFK